MFIVFKLSIWVLATSSVACWHGKKEACLHCLAICHLQRRLYLRNLCMVRTCTELSSTQSFSLPAVQGNTDFYFAGCVPLFRAASATQCTANRCTVLSWVWHRSPCVLLQCFCAQCLQWDIDFLHVVAVCSFPRHDCFSPGTRNLNSTLSTEGSLNHLSILCRSMPTTLHLSTR